MLSSTETFWNEIYVKSPTRLPNENDPVLVAALEFFGDVKGLRLLDLGCSEGRTSLFFASKEADVVSIDISEVAIRSLSDFCRQHNINHISPLQCSAFEISKLGKSDLIFDSMILHHIEPFEKFSKTLHDALNPGGKMFFYENNAFSDLLMWFRTHVIGKYGILQMGDDKEFLLTPERLIDCGISFRLRLFARNYFSFNLLPGTYSERI